LLDGSRHALRSCCFSQKRAPHNAAFHPGLIVKLRRLVPSTGWPITRENVSSLVIERSKTKKFY
jgi:hypothetical protein